MHNLIFPYIFILRKPTIREKFEITSTASHSCWRGTTSAEITCPVYIHYGIDISDIKNENIKIKNNHIYISIPKVGIKSVEVLTEDLDSNVSVGWGRFSNRSGDTQKQIAINRLRNEAIKKGEQEDFIISVSQQTAYLFQRELERIFPDSSFRITIK